MLERIAIIEGGSPGTYSSEGIAGTIHLVTARPQHKGMDARLGTGLGRHGSKIASGQFFGRSNLGDVTVLAGKEKTGGFSFNETAESTDHFLNLSRSFNGKGFWAFEYLSHVAETGLSNGTPYPLKEWDQHLERTPSDPFSFHLERKQHFKTYLSIPDHNQGLFNLDYVEAFSGSDLKNN